MPRGSDAASRPEDDGAWRVELRTAAGEPVQVAIYARDPRGAAPAPVAETQSLALYVLNGGRGDRATPPEVLAAVRAHAARLMADEAAGKAMPRLPSFPAHRA